MTDQVIKRGILWSSFSGIVQKQIVIVETYDTAVIGNSPQLSIGQISLMTAQCPSTGMGGNEGFRGIFSYIVETAFT